jgi:hypothetical protein
MYGWGRGDNGSSFLSLVKIQWVIGIKSAALAGKKPGSPLSWWK